MHQIKKKTKLKKGHSSNANRDVQVELCTPRRQVGSCISGKTTFSHGSQDYS